MVVAVAQEATMRLNGGDGFLGGVFLWVNTPMEGQLMTCSRQPKNRWVASSGLGWRVACMREA